MESLIKPNLFWEKSEENFKTEPNIGVSFFYLPNKHEFS